MARKKFQWSRDGDDKDGKLHFSDRTNRSSQKRASDKLDGLVKSLVKLSPGQLNGLPISEEVREALDEALRIQAKGRVRSGLRRQLLFVAGVLRQEDDADIEALVAATERLTHTR